MSSVNENKNIDSCKYSLTNKFTGFFTEDALDNLDDVISTVDFLSLVSGNAKDNKEGALLDNRMANGLFNILGRELEGIKASLLVCGGAFSESDIRHFLHSNKNTIW
ncbi:TPA: hypothetical protein ACIBOM_004777 [Salmonella enterica subsp. enterica serovar Reading]